MTPRFGYYDDWRTPIFECTQCGWQGTFDQGYVELYEELMDSSCPRCDTMLAFVSYPTIKESEANFDKLTGEEKQELATRKQFLAEWEAASLKSADQLPELEGPPFNLVWDMVGREEGHERLYTVLRHGEQEIWRELACWEGHERFGQVVEILKAKYGHRLLDVVPTADSKLYLYGDALRAIEIVEDIRKSFSDLRLRRANLADGWAFAQVMQQEEREEAERKAAERDAEYERRQVQPSTKPRRRLHRKRPR